MPVPRRRHSPSRRDKRRANYKMTPVEGVTECKNCGKPRLPHRVCGGCGEFRGRIYGKVEQSESQQS